MPGVYPTPIPQPPTVVQPQIVEAQQLAPSHQHLVTGIITTWGETATLPEEYFPYQIHGTPSAIQGTVGQPRAPTGSGYLYYSVHPQGAGFYKGGVRGDPWKEYYAEHGRPEPAIQSQVQQISSAAEAQYQARLYQVQTAGLREFRGTFSEYGQRLAMAPIGTPIPSLRQYEQIKYLQSPTAQWASEQAFRQAATPLSRYGEFAGVSGFRGTIVSPAPIPSLKPMPSMGEYLSRQGAPIPTAPSLTTGAGYGQTAISRLSTFPLYKGAAGISRGLTTGFETGVEALPLPRALKEPIKGFGGVFTGLPEYFASGISGMELAARKPGLFYKSVIPAARAFGGSIIEQARERPLYTAGQAVGIFTMARGISVGKAKMPEMPKQTTPSIMSETYHKMFGYSKTVPQPSASISEIRAAITPSYAKIFGASKTEAVRTASLPEIKAAITPSYSKLFGRGKAPSEPIVPLSEIKSSITPSYSKLFGKSTLAPQPRASVSEIKTALTPTKAKMFGTTQPTSVPAKITTWNLRPTPEYVRGKFTEYNVFRGGDIQQIAKVLKTTPTAPIFPRQIQPMGLQRTVSMPKQISAVTPVKGLRIVEPSAPKPSGGVEIKTSTGMVLIQRQKVVPKVEVIQAPKVETLTTAKTRMSMKVLPVMRMQPLTKAMELTAQRQKVTAAVSFVPVQKYKAVSMTAQRPAIKAMSVPAMRTVQAAKTAAIQMPKSMAKQTPAQRPIAISITPQIAIAQKVTPRTIQRTKMVTPKALKFRRPRGVKPYKYPEIARVAAPKQLMRRFRL